MKAVVLRKLRSAISLGLMLWCAGAGCMMVSYARANAMSHPVDATTSANRTVSGQTSGSMGLHDCCKAHHASERRTASSTNHNLVSVSLVRLEEMVEVPNSSDAISCCPLTSGTLVVTGHQRIIDENPALHGFDGASVVSSAGVMHFDIPRRLPFKNETYLRGCVFLI